MSIQKDVTVLIVKATSRKIPFTLRGNIATIGSLSCFVSRLLIIAYLEEPSLIRVLT